MRARRALLYMPGNDLHKIQKAATLGVDCVCMDLEDGVAINRKSEARSTIHQALLSLEFGKSERLVRINRVGSGLEHDDLELTITAKPDGFVIPKVDHADQLVWVSNQLERYEQKHAWPKNDIYIFAIIESPQGVVNLTEIARASTRLQAIIFGAEDFAGAIGAIRSPEAWEVFYARSAVVTHAAAENLQAIDMVFVDLNDSDGLLKEAKLGAQMGFSGKQIIHPNHINLVQEVFSPSEEDIQKAKSLIEAFQEQQEAGVGAFALGGKLIDAPIIRAAEQVLAKARAAGKID